MEAPKIYYTHYQTRELTGEGYPDPDPLDPSNWLIPTGAYLDAPPATRTGFAIVRRIDGTAWEYVEDHRGVVYDTSTGASQEYTALGRLPSGLTDQPYPGPGYWWNGLLWLLNEEPYDIRAQMRADRDARITTAGLHIACLQDAMDLCQITQGEVAALLAWKSYRMQLGRIEQLPGFPFSFEWPQSPEKP